MACVSKGSGHILKFDSSKYAGLLLLPSQTMGIVDCGTHPRLYPTILDIQIEAVSHRLVNAPMLPEAILQWLENYNGS